MASILKVDELRGIASAGDITVTSEGGAATQSLQQGLAKVWVNFNGTGTIAARDSLNVSGLVDNATADYTINYNNLMSNGDYTASGFAGEDADIIGLRSGVTYPPSSSSIRIAVRNYNATAVDRAYVLCNVNGDLA